jgi:peptidoglycan DL-endopeptidase CwlO
MAVRASATAAVVLVLYAAAIVLLLVTSMATALAPGSPGRALCGPGGTGQTVAAVQLDAEQMANAQTVVSTVARRELPAYAATVALATVAAESMFHNYLVFKDADSLGLFQQRVQYYTASVAANPAAATSAFLDRLLLVHGWMSLPLTEVASAVQMPRSDLRGAYAKWQPLAAALTAQLWPSAATTAASGARLNSVAPAQPDPCGDAGSGPVGGSAVIVSGLVLNGSSGGNQAVRVALAQLGKPYVWGSNGPTSWDCSSLTQAAWASAGVAIARTSFDQVDAGTPVTLSQARSGDLVFLAGTGGTATRPGHVGMLAGRLGAVRYLVSAPRTGQVVQMTPVASWASLIVSVRRIG